MEQPVLGPSGVIIPNKVSNPIEQQKGINNEADGENTDLNGLVPFLQFLNQQIALLTPAIDSVNEIINAIGEKTSPKNNITPGDFHLSKDENINGLLKQNRIITMVKELSEMKGVLPDGGSAAGKMDFERELENKISGIALKDSLHGIDKDSLFKNENSKSNANKLSDQTLRDNNFKILDNQSRSGNASKLSAGDIAGKLGLANMDALQTFSGEIVDNLKNVSKGNNIIVEKYNQDCSSNSLNATNNGITRVSSIDDISTGQIVNRVVSEIKENANSDGGRVKITLNPPSLGTLEMDVTVRNNKVEVIIVADNKDVQQTLSSHLDRLKGSLQNQGLTIDRCDVLMQNNREEYQQNYSQQTFYRDGSEKNSNSSREKYSEKLKPMMPVKPQIINNPSINPDIISIFA